MSRVELFEEIRRDRREGLSIRGLAENHGVHRRTVRQAIADPVPPVRKTPACDVPVLGPWKESPKSPGKTRAPNAAHPPTCSSAT